MTSPRQASSASRHELVARLLPVSLLLLLGVLPPETRGESLAGVALLIVLVVALAWNRRLNPVARPALVTAAVLGGMWVLVAVAPGATVEPLIVFFLAAALAIHGGCLAGSRDSRVVPWTLAVVGVLVSLWALEQSVWGLAADAARIEQGALVPDRDKVLARLLEGRAFAGFATPAALGGFLAMVLPVTAGLALETRGRARIASMAASAAMIAGVLSTRSVTAAAALVVASVIYLGRRRRAGRVAAVAAAVAVVLLIATVGLRRAEIFDSDRWDSPWRLRAGNFRVAAEVIAEHPFVGVGLGGYGEVYPRYRTVGDNESRHVHDLPLEMMAEAGIVPGMMASALFFWAFLGPVLGRRRHDPAWVDGVGVGLAAFAIHNLADFTAYFPSLLWTAALLRGVVYVSPERRDEAAATPRWAGGLVLAATSIVAALAVGSGLSRNALYQARTAGAHGDHLAAADLGRKAVRWAPWSINAHSVAAQALLESTGSRDALVESLECIERAIDLSPVRASSRELRARARLRLADTPGAYADLVEAARLYPLKTHYAQQRDRLAAALPGQPVSGAP